MNRTTIKLSLDGAELPTEFRLFTRGWNDTENGKFLFDDKAALSVMTAYKQWDVDIAIDLEHGMIDVPPGAPDPTARDARGWCKLELRNGELWACDVRWTPDGVARLTNKTQRYVSPAFEVDEKTKRVLKVRNVAITAMPATHGTPALVAANANFAIEALKSWILANVKGNRVATAAAPKRTTTVVAQSAKGAATRNVVKNQNSKPGKKPTINGDEKIRRS